MAAFVIDDSTPGDVLYPAVNARGLVPRDYGTHPQGSYANIPSAALDMPLVPRSEWSARVRERKELKSRVRDVRRTAGPGGGLIPSLDQDGIGYCFPKGTRVRMADGTQKNIEDVKLLDTVLTAEGNTGRVLQCHVRDHAGEMVTVKTYGHSHLRATPEHPILTRRGYVPFGDVTADDWVCAPRYAPQRAAVVLTAEHVRSARRILVGGGEVNPSVYNDVPDILHLTPGAGRIFGLWLAEGHIDASRNSVVWSFSAGETDTLAADLAGLLADEWGFTPTVGPGPGPNVTQVVIHGKLWCQLFRSLCGRLADGKRLHADLASGPREFLEAVFRGWMDGDGCTRGRRNKAYTCGATISHDLALNMYDIANAVGLAPSISREKPQVNRYAKTRRPVWKVQVNPDPSGYRPNYRLEAEPTRVWRKVRSVEREAFTGTVFNIGVEGDNSYVAEGLSVHNCWCHSGTMGVMLIRALMNQPYVRLSAFMVGCLMKGYADRGGWGADGVDFLSKNGVPSEEFWPQRSMNSSHDTPAMRGNAALHKVTEGWIDLAPPVYDRNLSIDQTATILLTGGVVVGDFNFWGHSVILMDWDEIEPGSFGPLGLNSWSDQWGDQGEFTLQGSRAVLDGGVGIRAVTPSAG